MRRTNLFVVVLLFLTIAVTVFSAVSHAQTYPKEIRGYKVERTVVEVRKTARKTQDNVAPGERPRQVGNQLPQDGALNTDPAPADADVDELIKLGTPELARVTPLGITFVVPIVVAPVKQSGKVDFLVFEDMVVNGTSVEIDEYHRAFELPNKKPLTLKDPLRFYIYLPNAVLAALGDWNESKETWPVTGRVYVFGKFKKSVFTFKRVVPVELKLTIRNPLREK